MDAQETFLLKAGWAKSGMEQSNYVKHSLGLGSILYSDILRNMRSQDISASLWRAACARLERITSTANAMLEDNAQMQYICKHHMQCT